MVHYKLLYFPIRGRAEPIRLLFHFAQVPFEDEIITFEKWPSRKAEMPLGQLPVLIIDNKIILGQTTAILRYLAGKYGLKGATDEENAIIDMFADEVQDCITAIKPYLMARFRGIGDLETARKENLIPRINNITAPIFEKALKSNPSGYLVGNKITWIDIMLADFSNRVESYMGNPLSNFPAVHAHCKRILDHPNFAKYLKEREQSAQL